MNLIKIELAPKVRHVNSLGQRPREMASLNILALKGRNQ